MALLASVKCGRDFEPLPTGTFMARCVTVCDLGIQPTPYGSKEKVYLGFEVYGDECRVRWEKDEEERDGPGLIGGRYTLSIHPKSILGQHLVSWRGKDFTDEERKGFDVFTVLGAPCMLSIVHNQNGDKIYANVAAIMRPPKGTEVPPLETELIGYTATDPKYSGNLSKLPEWMQKLATDGTRQIPVEPEPMAEYAASGFDDGLDDDIPF